MGCSCLSSSSEAHQDFFGISSGHANIPEQGDDSAELAESLARRFARVPRFEAEIDDGTSVPRIQPLELYAARDAQDSDL